MNCKKAQKWISQELDRELAPDRTARLEEHLGACESCRQTREAWTGFSNLLGTMDDAPTYTPEAALADVRRGIRTQTPEPRPNPVWGLKPAWISAAAALLVLLGVFAALNRFNPVPELALNDADQTKVESVEIGVPNAGFMVMEDAEIGMALIWIDDTDVEVDHAGS